MVDSDIVFHMAENEVEPIPMREVFSYGGCWQIADPRYVLLDGERLPSDLAGVQRRISGFGAPIELLISNEPLKPTFLPHLMATYERSLAIVKKQNEVREHSAHDEMMGKTRLDAYNVFDTGFDFWRKHTQRTSTAMLDRIMQIATTFGIISEQNDPAHAWATKTFSQLQPDNQQIVFSLAQKK
ncbi:MAG: hypothetical protein A2378_00230 [Candidatus Pacebacteria bacterium RIFOXYB1_FULL_44_10]|nr:MAG: hypothetical protein A2378_00230 [Candidatus Pacebacteria bacterium RIFOXYB1_FULL_44_10]HAX01570.1 hypothetical protein [Candidatus Paceibacterota bacterium]